MTPELTPVFAGTYFPKGRFLSLLDKINELCALYASIAVASDVFCLGGKKTETGSGRAARM